MSDEPITARELVGAYRSVVRPSAAAKQRMWHNVAAAPAPRPAAPPRAVRRRTSRPASLALAAALVLLCVSTYLLARARRDEGPGRSGLLMAPGAAEPTRGAVTPAPRQSSHHEPTAPAPASEPSASPPPSEPRAARPRPRPPARQEAAPEPPAAGDPVLAELALVHRIKQALDGHRPAEALALAEQHARTFARGSLAEEREALRVAALCEAGRRAEGRRARQEFLRAHPRSAYGDRVTAACPDSHD